MLKIELPFPISANSYWQIVNRRLIKTKRARIFIGEVVLKWMEAKAKGAKSFNEDDDLALAVAVYYPVRRGPDGDIDNLSKVLIDAMETAGMFPNDKQFRHIQFTRDHNPHKHGFVKVSIKLCEKEMKINDDTFIVEGVHLAACLKGKSTVLTNLKKSITNIKKETK